MMDIADSNRAGQTDREKQGLVTPSLAELFIGFLSVALTAFGGVMPITRAMMVERRRWVSGDEFVELLSVCQFLPGPNIGNMSIAVGARFHGVPGAVVSILGLMAVPCCIVIVLTTLYEHYAQVMFIRHIFIGVAATACGLVFAMAGKIALGAVKRRAGHGILFTLVAFVTIGVLRWPLVAVLIVLLPVSVLAYGKQAWILKHAPKSSGRGEAP